MTLFFLQAHLTSRCPLRCRHCYQTETRATDAETSTWVRFIEQTHLDFAPHFRPLEVNLTGGEPLLHPGFWTIAETLDRHGITWNLLTSGHGLDRVTLLRLHALRVAGIQISLDGLEADHDYLRGAGAFTKAVTTIDRIAHHGIRCSVAMTVHGGNIHRVGDMLDWTSRREILLGLHRYIPVAGPRTGVPPATPQAWGQLVTEMAGAHLQGRRVTMNDPLFNRALSARSPLHSPPLSGCTAGLRGVTVMHNGEVYPCRKIPIPQGNAFQTPLMRIWLDAPLLNHLRQREQYGAPCGPCTWRQVCGGCRAHAHSLGMGALDGDTLCDQDAIPARPRTV